MKPFGELVVSVYREGNLAPISGAQVEISDMNGNGVQRLQTDEFGIIQTVALPALPNRNNRSDNTSGAQAVQGKYNVTVKHPRYETVRLEGVRILEGSKAIPEVHLSSVRSEGLPVMKTLKLEDPEPPVVKIGQNPFNISELTVNSHAIVKSLKLPMSHHHVPYHHNPHPPIGLTIPETIRLHVFPKEGTNEPVRTVVVKFVDYIKGVVHQELDGFTEDEAIKANIIAFVSFTLNRYYTDHYRNQNKNYHITNDPSVDLGFIERPTMQEPLVRNTDAFFSQFIEYPGHPHFPFLALHCTSGCANEGKLDMEQSRILAREGKDHVQLIKQFYGQNYNPRSAAFIMINNQFYTFINPLKLGDSGGRVQEIQTYLDAIGKSYGLQVLRRAVEENGRFGEKTLKVVKAYQQYVLKWKGNKITGVVDQATWYNLLTNYYIAINSPSRNDHAFDFPAPPPPARLEAQTPTGELVVSVYQKGDLTPIPGTQVEISDMSGNIIRRLQTDQFGNMEAMTLPALPSDIRSENAGGAPAAQGKYIITVKHPNYEQVRVEYVKIHAGSRAIPEIHLTPARMEDTSAIKTIKIDDSKPTAVKRPENPYNISQLSIHPQLFYSTYKFAHGYEPNPHPVIGLVIPDTIRLHLIVKRDLITGRLIRTQARTIEVPFVDYIKGVLHKEINGFTEDEAIRANVIAVVSFTLNRYYTEFYRRQGKDYHITDNTGIDHDFDEHHLANAQEPLVRNIEEFFNKYIEYPGDHFFPFLSQY
ncbi:peptidoglycan-binding protein [Paenibacillus chartarius]|uniref:Peptidoglycan-binding protein n=1 Tax=Paenibacillus chartarius TaxID=747481 RepID=A0ABV6DH27_9BACL